MYSHFSIFVASIEWHTLLSFIGIPLPWSSNFKLPLSHLEYHSGCTKKNGLNKCTEGKRIDYTAFRVSGEANVFAVKWFAFLMCALCHIKWFEFRLTHVNRGRISQTKKISIKLFTYICLRKKKVTERKDFKRMEKKLDQFFVKVDLMLFFDLYFQ